jgi:hypothetical protein
VVDQTIVCWSRGRECGLAIQQIQAQDATRLQRFIATRVSRRK